MNESLHGKAIMSKYNSEALLKSCPLSKESHKNSANEPKTGRLEPVRRVNFRKVDKRTADHDESSLG